MNKTIIIASSLAVCIITLSVLAVQINKQNNESNLKQQAIDLQIAELEYRKEQDRKAAMDKSWNRLMINACIEDAEEAYWSYMELNGIGKRDDETGVRAATRFWDAAEKDKQNEINNCYTRYK